MNEQNTAQNRNLGQIVWTDLTVKNANEVKAFYEAVMGWRCDPVPVEDHEDYTAIATGSRPEPMGDGSMVAGICHALGPNRDMPPQWLIYVSVDNLDISLAKCSELGGKQVSSIRTYGDDRYCAIQDPAGAVIGIYEKSKA